MKSTGIIIVDIDGTLADAKWREHLIQEEGWDAFHAAGENDDPVAGIMTLVNAFAHEGCEIIAHTGCNEKFRAMRTAWLVENNIPFDALWMRPDGNFMPSPDLKMCQAIANLGDRIDEVLLVIDDREDILARWSARGVTTLLARPASGSVSKA